MRGGRNIEAPERVKRVQSNSCSYHMRRIQNRGGRWKPLKKTARAHAVALVVRNGNRMRGSGVL